MYPEISEQERFPILTAAGSRLLYSMRQHPHAPLWNWPNGEQLNASGLERVSQFANTLLQRDFSVANNTSQPEWLQPLVDFCLSEVPFYRNRQSSRNLPSTCTFELLPSCSREDLAPRVWEFVPDSQPIDELIVFSTSGTTGHPTRMLSHPATAACGVPLIEAALLRHGIDFPRGPDSVAITNVAAYRDAFTTAIVVAYLQEAGCVRVNLHPSAWRRESDRVTYINQWKAPVWLGDPIAFSQLRSLDIDHAPQAIVSSIMRMPSGLESELNRQYGCPVIDLYAMTEVGILGMRTTQPAAAQSPQHTYHEILPHDVYVEILGDDDRPVLDGQRGEVTVTSSRNPFMPLLRYRTGDFASLQRDGSRIWLVDLEGRTPVQFPLPSGRIVHSMEVTRLMRGHALLQYRLHQTSQDTFHFAYRGTVDADAIEAQLRSLLEHPRTLTIEPLAPTTSRSQKVIEYHSDLRPHHVAGTSESS